MGRKAIPNAEEKILREVIALSRIHSIKKISTIDIAYRMKVSESVIFKRFPTKEKLLCEAFWYSFKQIGDIDYMILLSDSSTKELKLKEFKKATDFLSDKILEANYITAYLTSEYFNLSVLGHIEAFNLTEMRSRYSTISDDEFLVFIRQYFVSLITYANAKAVGNESDVFAFQLMPEVKR